MILYITFYLNKIYSQQKTCMFSKRNCKYSVLNILNTETLLI